MLPSAPGTLPGGVGRGTGNACTWRSMAAALPGRHLYPHQW
jgi:hypothetical protein